MAPACRSPKQCTVRFQSGSNRGAGTPPDELTRRASARMGRCMASSVRASLRRKPGVEQRATTLELFYDLVFVFAITQVSHLLLDHLTWTGAGQATLILLVVWWSWNYTTWVTNELDPNSIVVRLLLIGLMLASLLMAIAIPDAFGDKALLFAGSYVAIQVGRHLFLTFVAAAPGTRERVRAGRILIWFLAAGVLWIAGALADGSTRTVLWLVALALDYAAPLVTYWVPGLPRLTPDTWEVGTGHFAERFQLFIIIALGESIVITGATTADARAHHGHDRRLRARVPDHRGALVALLQPRSDDRRTPAGAGREPHPARSRRLHLPARGDRRGDPAQRRGRRDRDRPPHRGAEGRRAGRGRRGTGALPARPRSAAAADGRAPSPAAARGCACLPRGGRNRDVRAGAGGRRAAVRASWWR